MSTSKPQRTNHDTPRVLVIEPDGPTRAMIVSLLRRADIVVDDLASRDGVADAVARFDYDVVLLCVSDDDEAGLAADYALTEDLSRSGEPARVILVTGSLDAATGVEAMRRGAADLLVKPLVASEVIERTQAAAEQAEMLRRQSRRIDRLKRVCKRLNEERGDRQEAAALGAAAEHAERDAMFEHLSRKIGAMTATNDFGAKIRGELDVELLLRAVLEHVLHSIGPTNAAVFLPTGEDEWSLGGYINYDVERASADIVLDRIADYVPQQFIDEDRLIRLVGHGEIEACFGEEADWIAGSEVVFAPCRSDARCLAILMLFRGRDSPFGEELTEQLELLRELMAEQLSRAVRVHNRAKPDEPWMGFCIGEGDEDDHAGEDWGMAA